MTQTRGKQRERPKTPDSGVEDVESEAISPEDEESLGAISELMRRAVALGLSSFFTTEGAVRKALEDTVPKDWTDFISEASDRTRSEFLERLSYQIGRVLEGIDLAELLERLLEGRRLEIKAEFRLTDEQGTRKTTVRFEKAGGEGDE